MKIVNTNNSENLKIGDFFVGTTEGLYLIRENGIVLKATNIDNREEITSIKEFGIGNFYVTTKEEDIYFLNTSELDEIMNVTSIININDNLNITSTISSETTTELTTLSTIEENINVISTTQWDKNISNLINQEQHLPIDNKTNFVTNNITSL